MPICPQCGKDFSGFSFGSNPATECKDCRKAKTQAAALNPSLETNPSIAVKASFTPVVTLTLMALNGLIYFAMGLSGVSWTEPSIEHAVRWGADFGPLTLGGEWWRILTSTFVHFGIVHIALNMWCLWSLGSSLERFMGRKAFAVIYVLSGLMASLTSIAWNPWRVSAGASGAIFGVAGAFVSYLFFKKAPMERAQVKQKLKSLLIFIGYNLVYGAAGNVDNSAHIGGLVAGLILGSLAPPILRQIDGLNPSADTASPSTTNALTPQLVEVAPGEESRVDRMTLQIALGGLVVLVGAALWIHGRNVATAHYGKAITLIRAGQLNQGIGEAEQAASLDTGLYFPAALLGELKLEQGDPAGAVPVLRRAMTLVPFYAYDVEHNLALAYLGAGKPKEALDSITNAIRFEKDDLWRAQYILVLAAEQSGNSRLAADTLRSLTQSKPDTNEAREATTRLSSSLGSSTTVVIPYSELVFKSKYWPLYP
jgi:membrane associated rhomboid family serine protease